MSGGLQAKRKRSKTPAMERRIQRILDVALRRKGLNLQQIAKKEMVRSLMAIDDDLLKFVAERALYDSDIRPSHDLDDVEPGGDEIVLGIPPDAIPSRAELSSLISGRPIP